MEELKELTNELRRQGKKVDEMHIVIAGQPQYGQAGLKDTLQNFDNRITKVEKSQSKRMFLAGSLGGALGVLFPKTVLAKIAAFFSALNPF